MSFRASVLIVSLCATVMCACNQNPVTTNSNEPKSAPATAAATPDVFAEIRAIYAKECESCHAADGTGGKVKLDDGKTLKVPSFRAGHALRHTDSDFRRQIMQGGDGMPAFKDKLTPQQVDELVRLVRREFQPGHTPPAEKSSKQ